MCLSSAAAGTCLAAAIEMRRWVPCPSMSQAGQHGPTLAINCAPQEACGKLQGCDSQYACVCVVGHQQSADSASGRCCADMGQVEAPAVRGLPA